MSQVGLSGFPVLCSMLEQNNGKMHPVINNRLNQVSQQSLVSRFPTTSNDNKNFNNISYGKIVLLVDKD